MTPEQKLVVILGPTATGKTALAVRLARRFGGEIWSADSRQVYRGLDIGTGKDLHEYRQGGTVVPTHLIDIVDPDREFSVFDFQKAFYQDMESLSGKALERSTPCLPILAGGTGLYLEAAIKGYRLPEVPPNPALRDRLSRLGDDALVRELRRLNPKLHNQTDLEDRGRLMRAIEIAAYTQDHPPIPGPCLDCLILGITCDRPLLRERIRERLHRRLAAGLVEEVRGLQARGLSWERLERLGLEYRYVSRYLLGQLPDLETLEERLFLAIADFAKRQMTWFRRMERQGFKICWLEPGNHGEAEGLVSAWLGQG